MLAGYIFVLVFGYKGSIMAKGVRFGMFSDQLGGQSLPVAVSTSEAAIGRALSVIRRFYWLDSTRLHNDVPMLIALCKGRRLHLSFKCRDLIGRGIPWTEVTAGTYNQVIYDIATAVAMLQDAGVIVWVTFNHEPDVDVTDSYSKLNLGTPLDFTLAWEHFFGVFYETTKARSVLVLDWWVDHTQFWPSAYVDAFGIDVYNRGASWKSLEELCQNGLHSASAFGKNLMLTEWGCVPSWGGYSRPSWIRDAHTFIRETLQIKEVCYWNQNDPKFGDYRITNDPDSLDAFREMALDPYFNRGN